MRQDHHVSSKAFITALLLAISGSAMANTLSGAGSTFVAPIMEKWAEDYAKKGPDKISYQSVGSGKGIQAIEAGTVDFGASDKPLSPAELKRYDLFQFPIVVGAIVPVVNLPGIAPGQLRFSGSVLAQIYDGTIRQWDAPEIRALNPKANLPPLPIKPVHRSDGSGTTYNWTDFLAKSSRQWRETLGVGLSVRWPVDQLAGDGNAGVAAEVKTTHGTIGYVEYAYALKNGLSWGMVQNSYHLTVAPTPQTIQAAAATVDWKAYSDFSVLMTNAGGPDAYPIAATTFVLMPRKPKDTDRNQAVLKFFRWALEEGDGQAQALHFVALPSTLVAMIYAYWGSR